MRKGKVNHASPEDSFVFVRSITTDHRTLKKPSWTKKEFEWSYETTYGEDEEWVSKDMKDQIASTVSSIQEKELKDAERIYIVLGIASQFVPNDDPSKVKYTIFYQDTLTVMYNLSAEILCYLNKEHTNLLVSCRLSDLTHLLNKRKFRLKYFDQVKRISPLLPQEQISKSLQEDSEWKDQSKEILIELIPNIPMEKKTEYANRLVQHLTSFKKPANSCCDETFVATKLDETSTRELLNSSNLVFRVVETPKGVLEHFSSSKKRRKTKVASIQGKVSSIQTQKSPSTLPVVCVLDSGVSTISQLDGVLIKPLDGYRSISRFDDDYRNRGHGTPIAYLAAFGENETTPKARIISYKIYEDNDGSVYYEGYKLALAKYSNEQNPNYSRIFVSSINFRSYNDPITAYVDRCIQENNVCMAFSAGNIDPNVVANYAHNGVRARARC